MTGTGNPALIIWVPDPDANDFAEMFSDAYCAEHKGVYLRTEGNSWTADYYSPMNRAGDWDEVHVGHGLAANPVDARWRAIRCADRWDTMQAALSDEMDMIMEQGNPDGDPDWWKAPVTP